jgi:hypothetical protein
MSLSGFCANKSTFCATSETGTCPATEGLATSFASLKAAGSPIMRYSGLCATGYEPVAQSSDQIGSLRYLPFAEISGKAQMRDKNRGTNRKADFTMEDLERLLPDRHQRESFLRLIAQLDSDPPAMVVLKGHLVIEEKLTTAIERFVFHPGHLEDARLTFAQKLAISRSLSLDENRNSMWDLVAKLNKLRNTLSHSLEETQRARAMDSLRAAYVKERGGMLEDWESKDEAMLLTGVIALCLGFLDGFEREIERFREHVDALDRVVNPHRHLEPAPESS